MNKIWEVDFTSFSGSSDVAYDNVGSQHLTSSTGIVKVTPLPGFSYRGGIHVTEDDVPENYKLHTAEVTNGRFTGPFGVSSRRSYVCWAYVPVKPGEGALTYLWGDGSATLFPSDGLVLSPVSGGTEIRFYTTGNLRISYLLPAVPGWYCIVVTCDRTLTQSKMYVNSLLVGSASNNTDSSYQTYSYIGHQNVSYENEVYFAYVATYDHILSQSEINVIYNDYLVDRTVAHPYQVVSGVVYGADGVAVSSATVDLIYSTNNSVVAHTVSDTDGSYVIDVPYSGNYTLVVSSAPSSGAAAVPLVATSGGVYFP